jgi:hypothetical protein
MESKIIISLGMDSIQINPQILDLAIHISVVMSANRIKEINHEMPKLR